MSRKRQHSRIKWKFYSEAFSCDLSSEPNCQLPSCRSLALDFAIVLFGSRPKIRFNLISILFISSLFSFFTQANSSICLRCDDDNSSQIVAEMDIRVRSGGSTLLLLVDGGVVSIFIQLLGHHIPFRLSRDQRRNAARVVLSRLLLRLFIPNRYFISLSNGLSRGWRTANRLDEAASTLYELDDILHRLPVLTAIRFFIFEHRIQFDIKVVSFSQDLSLLGVHGSHRASHKLPESVSFDIAHTLSTRYFPLERMSISYYL